MSRKRITQRQEERILTMHPEGKKGANISLTKYLVMKEFILSELKTNGELTYTELTEKAKNFLQHTWQGSIPWYLVTVKLDLEARKEIERVPGTNPQRLRLNSKA